MPPAWVEPHVKRGKNDAAVPEGLAVMIARQRDLCFAVDLLQAMICRHGSPGLLTYVHEISIRQSCRLSDKFYPARTIRTSDIKGCPCTRLKKAQENPDIHGVEPHLRPTRHDACFSCLQAFWRISTKEID